jgi:stage II sporulation protein AB (anti-sigma F factor)
MKEENYMTLEFPARSANEGFARAAIAAFAAQLDPTLDELGDIKTAVSEAVTNCIVHAYPDTMGPVILKARILAENVLAITVKDRGCGIADIAQARKPMFTTGGEERSGMGIPIMESFMSEVRILSAPGKGTTVHMKRKIMQRGGRA